MKKLVYKSIDPNIKVTEYIKENLNSLKNFNTNGLTIVTPDPNLHFLQDNICQIMLGIMVVNLLICTIKKLINL